MSFSMWQTDDPILVFSFYRMLLDHRIVVNADGIYGNVLKIKPPIVLTREDCDQFIQAVDSVLTKLVQLA